MSFKEKKGTLAVLHGTCYKAAHLIPVTIVSTTLFSLFVIQEEYRSVWPWLNLLLEETLKHILLKNLGVMMHVG